MKEKGVSVPLDHGEVVPDGASMGGGCCDVRPLPVGRNEPCVFDSDHPDSNCVTRNRGGAGDSRESNGFATGNCGGGGGVCGGDGGFVSPKLEDTRSCLVVANVGDGDNYDGGDDGGVDGGVSQAETAAEAGTC